MRKFRTTKNLKKRGFTLAETLITLGIVGIVAALTIPSLIASYQKKQTVVKLKKVYAILNQIARSSSDENGDAATFLTANTIVTEQKTKEFFEKYWFSYLNGPTIIKSAPDIYTLNGKNLGVYVGTYYDWGARAYFTTMDGISYFVWLMKWVKDENTNESKAYYSTTQTIYVDLNGTKQPNTLGLDVFTFEINFDDNNAVCNCAKSSKEDVNRNCEASGTCCAEKIKRDGWTITKDYPWK